MDLKPYYEEGTGLPAIPVTNEHYLEQPYYMNLYYAGGNYRPEELIGPVTFVEIKGIVVGLGAHKFIHPLLNEKGSIIVIQGDFRKEVSPEQAKRYGVFRIYYVPTKRSITSPIVTANSAAYKKMVRKEIKKEIKSDIKDNKFQFMEKRLKIQR